MSTEWYLKSNDTERGPMPFRELADLARNGSVAPTDLVRSTWHKDWQPAEAVLKGYIPVPSAAGETDWSNTVKAALAARAKHAPPPPREPRPRRLPGISFGWLSPLFGSLSGLFGWVTPVLQFLVDLYDVLRDSGWLRIGSRILCALACAGLVAISLDRWSVSRALQSAPNRRGTAAKFVGRRLPVVGECSRGEYLFLIFNLAAVTGAAVYFGTGLIAPRSPDEPLA